MVALVIANLAHEKFGGDSLVELKRNFHGLHRTDTELLATAMILKIVKYPEPVLEQPGEPVTEFDDELRKLVADMFETTYASQGIGLAAPQVGVSKRLTVIDLSQGKDPAQKLVLINPGDHLQRGQAVRGGGLPEFSRYSREGGARGQGPHPRPG